VSGVYSDQASEKEDRERSENKSLIYWKLKGSKQ